MPSQLADALSKTMYVSETSRLSDNGSDFPHSRLRKLNALARVFIPGVDTVKSAKIANRKSFPGVPNLTRCKPCSYVANKHASFMPLFHFHCRLIQPAICCHISGFCASRQDPQIRCSIAACSSPAYQALVVILPCPTSGVMQIDAIQYVSTAGASKLAIICILG